MELRSFEPKMPELFIILVWLAFSMLLPIDLTLSTYLGLLKGDE